MTLQELISKTGLHFGEVTPLGPTGEHKPRFTAGTYTRYKNLKNAERAHKWRLALVNAAGYVMEVEFTMGSAHREVCKGTLAAGPWVDLKMPYFGKVTMEDVERLNNSRPKAPDLETVLDCLISDAQSVTDEPDLRGWAESLGYNSDSIRDRAVYDACHEQTANLRRLLREHFEDALYETERL